MKNVLSVLLLILILSSGYLLTLKGVPGNPAPKNILEKLDEATMPFELSPERGRYALTLAMAENKTFELKGDIAKMALPDLGFVNGKYYSLFSPGLSLLILPFYYLGRMFNLTQLISFSLPGFFAILNGILIYLILKKLAVKNNYAMLAAIIFAFATTSWPYAVTLYQHHITTFFILWGFYAVSRYREFTRFYWMWGFLVWLNYAFSIVVDSPNAILLLPVIAYFLISSVNIVSEKSKIRINFRLPFFYTIITFLAVVIMYGTYNKINFGSYTKLSGTITNVQNIEGEKLTANGIFQEENRSAVNFFKAYNIPHGLYTLLVSDERGLFYFVPIFLIALLGIPRLFERKKLETIILINLIIFNVFLYSAFGDPWGGWAFGPRYLIPSMSIFSILLGITFDAYKNILIRLLSLPLILYSIFVSLTGALTTIQVPPKSEAVGLNIGYNYLYNLTFLLENRSSSFVFNTYFSKFLNLTEYAGLIFIVISFFVLFLLLIVPIFDRKSVLAKN